MKARIVLSTLIAIFLIPMSLIACLEPDDDPIVSERHAVEMSAEDAGPDASEVVTAPVEEDETGIGTSPSNPGMGL